MRAHDRSPPTATVHLDDTALRDTAAQAAGVIARAMGYSVQLPPLRDDILAAGDWTSPPDRRGKPCTSSVLDWLGGSEPPTAKPSESSPGNRPRDPAEADARTETGSDGARRSLR